MLLAVSQSRVELLIILCQVTAVPEAVKLLNKWGKKPIAESIITLLGLVFRGGVSDTRLSPAYDVIDEFSKSKGEGD